MSECDYGLTGDCKKHGGHDRFCLDEARALVIALQALLDAAREDVAGMGTKLKAARNVVEAARSAANVLEILARVGRIPQGGESNGNLLDIEDVCGRLRRAFAAYHAATFCPTCGGCGNVPSAKRLADYPCAPVPCPDCKGGER